MSDDERLERIMDRMTEMLNRAQAAIDAFWPKFGENPIGAMSWSENLFKAVADREATTRAVKHLLRVGKDGEVDGIRTLDDVRGLWMTEIRRGVGRVGARGAMTTANLMEDRLLQASEMVLQILNEEL